MDNLLIIQPWFTGKGHPAQSLINTASALGMNERVEYLVSCERDSEFCRRAMIRLATFGHVFSFSVNTQTGKSNTIRALLSLVRLRLTGHRYQRIFFFDATLPVLATLWPIFSWLLGVGRISVLHLQGPEIIGKGGISRLIVKRFLKRSDVRLYLRTEELAQAWLATFAGRIGYLPSLEIPDAGDTNISKDREHVAENQSHAKVRFGIIGQIRLGKGIEWLVPFFQDNPEIGQLTIAGAIFNQVCRERLSVLNGFEGFVNRFMSEDEMLEQASSQDYLLMLYDQDWDPRLESAVLYLAARVNRPVIVYDGSWSGRMVKEFGCGLLAPVGSKDATELFRQVPRPGDVEYIDLLKGVAAFKKAHSVESLRNVVMHELLG